uniref:NADH-ubiquinone oxidoreductase chain 3 n=1 Tax=Amblyomma fimbriatum TaxID=65641 RepID=H9M767_9ACAR|nr:NADH dehydrogenase subunit 3 [Amblyomma fimbriatum]AET63084.1 NADH dehydrogenase subunit 3 [Amblyomma fimbriatum]
MYLVYIIIFIIMVIYMTFFLLSFKIFKTKEKMSPFECGFDPLCLSRVPFSLKFFFIAIVFLVFDVEIIVILPYPILLNNKNLFMILSFVFINLIILLGLFYEWKSGMINWMK